MPVGLLGTLEVVARDGRSVEIGGSQPRIVLALLVAAGGRVVAFDTLLDAVWGEEPPQSAAGTLQTYVSRLRRALAEAGGTIVREPAGYRLEIDAGDVDVARFEALADDGRAALDAGDPATARARLLEAEALWRGPALLDVRDRPHAAGVARRLDQRRLAVIEDRITAELDLGRHAAAVGELTQLVNDNPLHEGFWALLALARYRSAQQGDALRAIADARRTLIEQLGVEPTSRLRDLESRILAQDAALDLAIAAPPGPGGAPTPAVAGAARPPVPASVDRPATVGRDAEVAALLEALDAVTAGRPGVVVLQGEPGVGKTRLVEDLAAEATYRGGRVVWGRSLEGGAAPAYWPWLGVLRSLRDAAHQGAGTAVDQLLDATGAPPVVPTTSDRSMLLDGVLRLLAAAADRPTVVVFEDIQWAGRESLELLAQVIAGLEAAPILLVLTLRHHPDDDQPALVAALAGAARRPGTRRLSLRGLDEAATEALVAQVHGGPVDATVARLVHERAEGNPFYAIELVRLLGAEGLADAATLAGSAVPASVRDVVAQRLGRLPPSTVELLRLAAVAGRDVDIELLSRATGRTIERCLDELDEAVSHRLLVAAGLPSRLRFSHALVREVIADDLSALRRARAHLLLADAIEAGGRGDDTAEVVAEHLWAAAVIGVGRRAADALDRAAEVAIRRFAVGTAVGLLERSLDLRRSAGSEVDDVDAELATLTRLIWARRAVGDLQGGMDHYGRGAELARRIGRHDVELEMLWAAWSALEMAREFERARRIAEEIRSRADVSDDPVVQMAGSTIWAIQCWLDADLLQAHDALSRAAEVTSHVPTRDGDRSLAAEMRFLRTGFQLYIAEVVGELSDPERAFARAAEDAPSSAAVAMIWCWAAASAGSAGDLDRVERCARRVLDAEAHEPLGFWGMQARMYQGAVRVAAGEVDEGRALFDAGLTAYRTAGMRVGAALMLALAASAEVLAGDLTRAAAHIEAAMQEVATGERYAAPAVSLAEADLAEASGAPASEVRARRREARALARRQGSLALAERAAAAERGECWMTGVDQSGRAAKASTRSASSA